MPEQMRPGVFSELFARLAAQVEERTIEALDAAAELVEERARQSVSARSHPLRTPTPARRGGPPAMISGTLAKSIGRSKPEISSGGVQIRVGMITGMYAPYSPKTPTSLVAKYLEVDGAGKSRVKYPFLLDAFKRTARPAALSTFKVVFGRPWV